MRGTAVISDLIIALVIVLVLPAGLLIACADDRPTLASFCAPPVDASPVRGPEDAWVSMVEFADFECPYCGRVEATLTELFATYPDDLRLIFKNFPLPMHEHAEDAAVAAECALDQGHFWEMHDLLFASQEALSPADLEGYATTVGLDVGAWQECLTSSAPGERIAVDKALARQSGVSATPTFFINGAVIEGAAPINDFERVINDRLATAQASGIPQDQYYDELQRTPCQ